MACSVKETFLLDNPDRADGLRILILEETVTSSGGDRAEASWPSSDHVLSIAPRLIRATTDFTSITDVKMYSYITGDILSGTLEDGEMHESTGGPLEVSYLCWNRPQTMPYYVSCCLGFWV